MSLLDRIGTSIANGIGLIITFAILYGLAMIPNLIERQLVLHRMNIWPSTQGIQLTCDWRDPYKGDSYYYVTYEYTVEDSAGTTVYSTYDTLDKICSYEDWVTVHYDPNRPHISIIADSYPDDDTSIGVALLAVILLFVATIHSAHEDKQHDAST